MKRVLTAAAAGIALLLLAAYIFYIRPHYYLFNGGKIEFAPELRQELIQGQYLQILPYEDTLYFCSREGLEKRNLDGSSQWTKPFQMLAPLLKQAGDYLVVADILGHDALLFDKNGFLAGIRENFPIVSAWLSEGGQLVLVLEADLENKIKVYSREGVPLIERGSVLRQDGYPVAAALSGDGLNLTTSYVDALNGGIHSQITMFGFADYHEDLDEFILRADAYEGELMPELHYFGQKTLWVIGNRSAYLYPMSGSKELYSAPLKLDVDGDLLAVYYTKNETLLYTDTKEIGERRYRLKVYRMGGELIQELFFAQEPNLISAQADEYFVADQEKITKYRGSRMIWQYPFHERLDAFYEVASDRYLLIQPMSYTVWEKTELD